MKNTIYFPFIERSEGSNAFDCIIQSFLFINELKRIIYRKVQNGDVNDLILALNDLYVQQEDFMEEYKYNGNKNPLDIEPLKQILLDGENYRPDFSSVFETVLKKINSSTDGYLSFLNNDKTCFFINLTVYRNPMIINSINEYIRKNNVIFGDYILISTPFRCRLSSNFIIQNEKYNLFCYFIQKKNDYKNFVVCIYDKGEYIVFDNENVYYYNNVFDIRKKYGDKQVFAIYSHQNQVKIEKKQHKKSKLDELKNTKSITIIILIIILCLVLFKRVL